MAVASCKNRLFSAAETKAIEDCTENQLYLFNLCGRISIKIAKSACLRLFFWKSLLNF